MKIKHRKWPSIEAFHNMMKSWNRVHPNNQYSYVNFRPKPKLHGTNAAVHIYKSQDEKVEVRAQKRSTWCTPNSDNCGFAAWVFENEEVWKSYSNFIFPGESIVFHGEWAGPGVQKGDACSLAPEKFFAIFAIEGVYLKEYGEETSSITSSPQLIEKFFIGENENLLKNVFIVPFMGEEATVKISLYDNNDEAVSLMNEHVNAIAEEDWYCKEIFNVEGPGEGLVYYPISAYNVSDETFEVEFDRDIDRELFSTWCFKAKGERHMVNKQRKPVEVDQELLTKQSEVADKYATENRFEQAVHEACDGEYNIKKMGKFLAWVGSDIAKEAKNDLEEAGWVWKNVAKGCTSKASQWYKRKCFGA